MKKLAILATLACAAGAQASEIALLTPIAYDPTASVVDKVKQECKLEEQLTSDVSDAFRKNNIGPVVATAEGPGEVIKVRITHVLGFGGGAWSGPKAITVHADLMKNGKVERTTRINRWTTGGMWGGFKGTCSILNRSSAAIAKDLVKWAHDPTYSVEDSTPKDAPKESDAGK